MAQIKIRTFAGMREILGGKEVPFDIGPDETLGSLVEKLIKAYGKKFESQIKDPATGSLIPILILVNERVLRSITDQGEKIADGDTVTILIPFDGGSR